MYIKNGLTLGYTVQTLNLFNSHSFSKVFLTHTQRERRECLKETDNGVYPKKKHMTSCDWQNIKWNAKCGTKDLYSKDSKL